MQARSASEGIRVQARTNTRIPLLALRAWMNPMNEGGLPMPREPALLTSKGMDAEAKAIWLAQSASSERSPAGTDPP